jgi:hypothetical protein
VERAETSAVLGMNLKPKPMKTTEYDRYIGDGKKPAIFSSDAATYWETLAVSSIRRLYTLRSDLFARKSLRGWVKVLREVRTIGKGFGKTQ